MDQRVYRVRVMKCFLRAAIPLTKLNFFRELLEEDRFRLSDGRHMSDFVPPKSRETLRVKYLVDHFRRHDTVRGGNGRCPLHQRFVFNSASLIRLQLLTKCMTGEEIAREIINALFVQYSICSNLIIAMMRDRAACNGVALRMHSECSLPYVRRCWILFSHA